MPVPYTSVGLLASGMHEYRKCSSFEYRHNIATNKLRKKVQCAGKGHTCRVTSYASAKRIDTTKLRTELHMLVCVQMLEIITNI